MRNFTAQILELIRQTSTDLPKETEEKLAESLKLEDKGSAAAGVLESMLTNVKLAREKSIPICQDTGTPLFFIQHPSSLSTIELKKQVNQALEQATNNAWLRPNAVHSLTGVNTGNSPGDPYYPAIHFEESKEATLKITLMLKGGGCENVGTQYKLPDNRLGAGRDIDGIKIAVLDAVLQAQGRGCAPGVLGVAIGGDRGSSYAASKEVLLRPLNDSNPIPALAKLENEITEIANQLDIGPMGFGGRTTLLATKITHLHRLPASYFVSVSYMCWAYRRRSLEIEN